MHAYLATLGRGRGRGARSTSHRRRTSSPASSTMVEPALARRVAAVRRPRPPRACAQFDATRLRCSCYDAGRHRASSPADALAPVARDADDLAVLALHRGHRRRAEAGDAHARLAAREHRTDAVAPRAARRPPTTSRSACCRSSTCTASTSCSGSRCMAGAAVVARRSLPSRSRRSRACAHDRVTVVAGGPRDLRRVARARRRPPRRATRSRACGCACRARRTLAPRPRRRDARALRRRRARRLRPHRGVAGRDDDRGRGRAARRVRSVRRCRASRCGSSTSTATTCSTAIPARSSCAAPNVFAGYWNDADATHAVLGPTVGCTPATSASPTPTAG